MILAIIINFSILFTFVTFSFFILEYYQYKQAQFIDLKPFIIGIITTLISLLLMKTAIPFDNGLIGDLRNIAIIISGLIGGPIAILLASLLTGFFRIFFLEIGPASFVSGLNIIFIGIVFFLISLKKRITYKTVHFYVLAQIIEVSIVIYLLDPKADHIFTILGVFISTHLIGFYITYFVLKMFQSQFDHIRTIEKLAETDYITDLPNNRKANTVLQQALLERQVFSLLLIDIDQFKTLNRRYGHNYGDELLFQLAARLKIFTKVHEGFAARISGEEFYLICYDTPPATAIQLADEFISVIRDEPFVLSNDKVIHLTVSIGIANYPDNGQTIRKLAEAVDAAAVEATRLGSNQITHCNQLN